jgi:hypothetical protein
MSSSKTYGERSMVKLSPSNAITVLQECYDRVTRVLQGCYKSVTRVLQGCYKRISKKDP